jgi:hypothetical protein
VVPRGLRIDTDCGWPNAAQVVEIEPGRVSGHRLHLCPFIDALLAVGPPLPATGGQRPPVSATPAPPPAFHRR